MTEPPGTDPASTGPGDERAGTAGHGRVRASRADRDHVVEVLKTAFVQERLTKDELDARVSGALAARTQADLAALTDDLPADLHVAVDHRAPERAAPASGPAPVASQPARTLGRGARRAGMCLVGSLAVYGIAVLAGPTPWDLFAILGMIMGVVAASGFLGYGIIDAWREWRAGGTGPADTGGPGGPDPDGLAPYGLTPGGLAPDGLAPGGLDPGALGSGGMGSGGLGSGGLDGGAGGRRAGTGSDRAERIPGGAGRDGEQPGRGADSPGRPGTGPAQAGSRLAGRARRAGLLPRLVVDLGGRGVLLDRLDPAQR